jgi:hypothetical protein
MSQADLLTEMTAMRPGRAFSHSLAVLIEVPAVTPPPTTRALRRMPRRARTLGRQPGRSRRRLRREVRLAGCALIALVPLVSACTLGWSNRPDRIVACVIPDQSQRAMDLDGSTDSPLEAVESQAGKSAIALHGVVVLSIEPAVAPAGTTAEAPVIFPGYVLPDDSREDSLHEGS